MSTRPHCRLPIADCRLPNHAGSARPLRNRKSPIGNRKSRAGFTLIELLMVIAISAIALTVGLIRMGRLSVFLSEGERAATDLVADLRYAQSEAIIRAKNHYLLFTSDGFKLVSYAIYRVETGGDVKVEPTRVVSASAAITGLLNRAEFRPDGTAVLDYTYTVTSPGRTFTVSVQALWGNVTFTRQ